jgi:hypothetical protein
MMRDVPALHVCPMWVFVVAAVLWLPPVLAIASFWVWP